MPLEVQNSNHSLVMTTTLQTPNSSVKSSATTMEDDGFCFTPCRRDANCNCKICQASINATLDLLPISAQRSSITKIPSSKPSPPQTPLFIDSCTVSTPESENSRLTPVKSTDKTDLPVKFKSKKTGFRYGLITMKCVLVLCLSFVGKLGFSFVDSTVMRTRLSPEIVRKLSEKSLGLGFEDVKEQLGFLNLELQNLLGATESEATSKIPNWEIVQDGLMLRSRCQLHKSGTEEVSVWGWPLQTSGLLTTDFDLRSFTILSGRVTEWANGDSSGLVRTANASWEQGKWSVSVWRLNENTWIVEYKRSFVFDNTRPFLSAMEFLRFKMMRSFEWMKQMCPSSNANHLAPT